MTDSDHSAFAHLKTQDPWLYNKLLNEWEQKHGIIRLQSYPTDVSIPFVESCNARCLFCSYWSAPERYMTEKEIWRYKAVFEKLAYVGINPAGEPLRHPQFDTLIPLIRSMVDPRCSFYLVTNGQFLNDKKEVILENIDSLTISLNAATQDTHGQVMGLKGQFEQIIAAIKDFVERKQSSGRQIQVYTTFVVLQENIHEVPDFIRLCEAIGIDRIYFRTLATANVNNPIKPGKNKKYCSLQPALHPRFGEMVRDAKAAIETSATDIVAEPEEWQNDVRLSAAPGDEPDRCDPPGWITVSEDHFPFTCQYLYKYLIDPRLSNIQPVCVYMEHLPGFAPVVLDLDNFESVRNADAMIALRTALNKGPRIPQVCTCCNILKAFKLSDIKK